RYDAAAVGDANLAALNARAVVELVERDALVDESAKAERELADAGEVVAVDKSLAYQLLRRSGANRPHLKGAYRRRAGGGKRGGEYVGIIGGDRAGRENSLCLQLVDGELERQQPRAERIEGELLLLESVGAIGEQRAGTGRHFHELRHGL